MTTRRIDNGFTLVELVLAVAILGVIMFPLGNLVLGYFDNTTATQQLTSMSHDQQITGTYFAEDVGSLGRHASDGSSKQSVWTSTTGIPYSCGSGISVFLALAWDEHSSTGTATTSEALYGTRSVTANGRTELQLVRLHCSNSSSTPDFSSVLAHNLTATPTVTCDGASCAAATYPQSVTLSMTLSAGSEQPTQTVTLVGQRRQT